MRTLQRVLEWKRRLLCGWIRANVHASLLLTLGLIACGLLWIASYHADQAELAELRPWAFSLPVVWVVSLAVRIAAQHLAIGIDSIDMHTRLGPTGNISTDYEFLRPWQIFRYAVAGHLATLSLLSLGVVVCAALLPIEGSTGSWSAMFDFSGGWDSLAWATQIMWVNALIFALNMLPTIPFDNRALLYSLAMLYRRHDEARVLRSLSSFNSHLATALLGGALSIFVVCNLLEMDPMGWYLLAAAGVYLLVASRWEKSRAIDLEEQCVSFGAARQERRSRSGSSRHERKQSGEKESSSPVVALSATSTSAVESTDSSSVQLREPKMHVSEAYLDEILRKLHREGAESLSVKEQEALLTASQKLKDKQRLK